MLWPNINLDYVTYSTAIHQWLLVTGSGANRVGRVIARSFAEAGYSVVLHAYRSVNELKQTVAQWSEEGYKVSYVTGRWMILPIMPPGVKRFSSGMVACMSW